MSRGNHMGGNKGKINIIFILITIADLLFLYFIKYLNQDLSLSDFRLFNFGNILNLIFAVLLILALVLNSLKKQNSISIPVIVFYMVLINFFLLLAALSTKIKVPLPNIYVLDHPMDKVFTGALFTVFQFIQFNLIILLLLNLSGDRNFLFLKSLTDSVALIILLISFALFFMHIKKSARLNYHGAKNLHNVAVVLGAAVWSNNKPSPSLVSRLDKGYELYKEGYVGKIQLTGSNAPGELSEAEVAYRYLKTKDIDTSNVWMENKTTSTVEQVQFVKNHLLHKKGVNKVIIVSDAYHLTRVKEICNFYNIKVGLAASYLNLSFANQIYYKVRESIGLLLFWFFAL